MSRQLSLNFEPSERLRNKAPNIFASRKLGTNQLSHSGCLGELSYSSFYRTMDNWKLSDEKMRQLSYPRQHPLDSNRAEIVKPYHKFLNYISDPNKRMCEYCKKIYNVNNPRRPCNHHRRKYHYSAGVHICCNRPKSGAPCVTSPRCVTSDIDVNNLFGYKNTSVDGLGGNEVYALDAEMAFTEEALEACAVTLVDANCQVVYEKYFLPNNPIIDYNTYHSNLTKENFLNVSTTLADVHQELLRLIGPSSIVVGHGLKTDLISLKLIHSKVIDTMVLFPPKNNYTRSLQNLKEEYLGDNSETKYKLKCTGDTIATIRLVLLKAFLHENGYSNVM